MPFRPFHTLFPEIGQAETRSLRIPPNTSYGVPADEYAFLELYCDERKCDCRRVMFNVLSRGRQRFEAVITWGWETPQFYSDWLSRPTPEAIAGLIGPCLNIGSPASEIAPGLVEVARAALLSDCAYADRIKRHYSMFRRKIDRRK